MGCSIDWVYMDLWSCIESVYKDVHLNVCLRGVQLDV